MPNRKYDYNCVVITIYCAEYLNKKGSILCPPSLTFITCFHRHTITNLASLCWATKIHRIGEVDEFHKALGYNDEIRKTGLMPEEYIWERYHRDESVKSEVCFQAKIIEYLNLHSPSFKENYAFEREHWLSSCKEKWSNKSTECTGCFKGYK